MRLQFSKHVLARIKSRDMIIDEHTVEQISQVTGELYKAGSKLIVIIQQQRAFIVNTEDFVIVTVMGINSGQTFSNIDGAAVIA